MAPKRAWTERLMVIFLVGVSVLSVAAIALLAVYVNRIDDAASGVRRADALPSYSGRPTPVAADGVAALNFLVTTTDSGRLDAVLIAHLSSSRRALSLIALPSDLVPSGQDDSLADAYASDPLSAAKLVEDLTDARMDHQLRLDLASAATIVDAVDGVQLAGHVDGSAAVAYIRSETTTVGRSVSTAQVLRATLVRVGAGVTDPGRFGKLLDALQPSLIVDGDLSDDAIMSIIVESRVHPDEIPIYRLGTTADGHSADPTQLSWLRQGLADDDFTTSQASVASPAATLETRPTSSASEAVPVAAAEPSR